MWGRNLAAPTEEGWIAETPQIDSSFVKAHRYSGGAKGGSGPGHWHLARWPATKIHTLVDVRGRPLRLALTPGNTSDIKGADLLVSETAGMKRLIADRGNDANRLRTTLRKQGTIPVIPGRPQSQTAHPV